MQADKARRQLGEFLRARRDRLRPEDFGLPPGQRRRAPGLRREEAAQLCGISPTWFTWIEQGRTAAVSVATLAAIAQGLRLSRAERAYVFELAARADPTPPQAAGAEPRLLRPLLQSLHSPAYVLDRHWDAVLWNRAATALFPDWLSSRAGGHAAPRNLLRYVFLDPSARSFIVNWPERGRRLVAEYRADTAAWRNDPVRQALVHELSDDSTEFRQAWSSQSVRGRDGGRRSFNHPRRGRCHYEQLTLRLDGHPELKLTALTPADDA